MPMEFLRQVAEEKLPFTVFAPSDIDKLRVLRAAGLVTAFIPPAEELRSGAEMQKAAQVLAITAKGIAALQGRLDDADLLAPSGSEDAGSAKYL
ncbi:hypothetical protein [Variovorax ginsengisoli]|uniref:Uncharacterized protein n=1 Tax=Variovorax ginsengisoli TaxID=363844 RepID=A0ABT8S8J9_9BURK|nr:hypothetical protein [Variovorax ginsengisoli]MDN8615975.1 hypothetical protein [Variovorax ginsengisoli]MDO1535145.1 hypothetical protein [Variovorax ginsengisoli]